MYIENKNMKRNERVTIIVTKEEKELFEKIAYENGSTLSSWARVILKKSALGGDKKWL